MASADLRLEDDKWDWGVRGTVRSNAAKEELAEEIL